MAAANLILACDGETITKILKTHESNEVDIPVGPICTLVPSTYHRCLSTDILKSIVCSNVKDAEVLRKKVMPADIPIIAYAYTEQVYEHVLEHLTPNGKKAVEEIHPWIVNLLCDWCHFDGIICSQPLPEDNTEDSLEQTGNTQTITRSAGDTGGSTWPFGTTLTQDVDSTQLSGNTQNITQSSVNKHTIIHPSGNTLDSIKSSRNTQDSPQPSGNTHDSLESSRTNMYATEQLVTSTKWSRDAVLQLIHLHSEHENLFTKVGVKKKSVWQSIAKELRKLGYEFTGLQCEQKWKNITKTYRDTVDQNRKSGAERKECPYYKELENAYGFKPNVKPVFTSGSTDVSGFKSIPSTSQEDNIDADCEVSTVGKTKECCVGKRKVSSSNDDILNFLKKMHSDIEDEQKNLAKQLDEQHADSMKAEERKINIMNKLVENLAKNT